MPHSCTVSLPTTWTSSFILAERLRRPPVPDIPNLFYESAGPIYDEIPGESFAKLKSTVPSTPCSEYVTIEGKMNGDIDRYDQSHTSGLCI